MIWPAQAAADAGYDVHLGEELEPIQIAWSEEFKDDPPPWVQAQAVISAPDVDVMVFQRVIHRQFTDVIPLLQARGIKVVVDIDDLFDSVDRHNAAWYALDPHWHSVPEVERLCKKYGAARATRKSSDGLYLYLPDHVSNSNRINLKDAMRHADLVTVSTPALGEAYQSVGTPIRVVRNGPPASFLFDPDQRASHPVPVVGWTGSIATHPGDLEEMGPALAQVRRRHDSVFTVIGTGVGVRQRVGIDPDVTAGWVDLDQYPAAYSALDIALCPLRDTRFNRAKSWIKPLEAACVGAVPIMSPTPEYCLLAEQGIGLLAKNPREWAGTLRRLIMEPDERLALARSGFAVAARLLVNEQVESWVRAWRSVLEVKV